MRRQGRGISETPYVLMVFLIFSLFALALVLFGAKVYQHTARDMEGNHQLRAGLTYVANKLHSADTAQAVTLEKLEEVTTLQIRQTADGFETVTYIYQYEGALMELNADAGFAFDPQAGTAIASLASFDVTQEDGRIVLEASAGEGQPEARLLITLRTGGSA